MTDAYPIPVDYIKKLEDRIEKLEMTNLELRLQYKKSMIAYEDKIEKLEAELSKTG